MLYFNRSKLSGDSIPVDGSKYFIDSPIEPTEEKLRNKIDDQVLEKINSVLTNKSAEEKEIDNVLTPDQEEVKPVELQGFDITTVNELMQSQILKMMVETGLTERQLYISALELMRKEIAAQQRVLKGLAELMKEMRSMQKEGDRKIAEDTFNEI